MTELLHTLASTTPDSANQQVVINLLIILAVAGVVALALGRLRVSLIPAFLLAGALIGPGALGFISDARSVNVISELALILLMFSIGLHLDLSAFSGAIRPMVTAGITTTALSVLLLWPLARLFGLDPYAALGVAMAFSLSSTAVVVRILHHNRHLKRVSGRFSLAIAIVQDLMVVPMLAMIEPLARLSARAAASDAPIDPDAPIPALATLFTDGLLAVMGIALVILVCRFVLPRLLAEAARLRSAEVMLVLASAFALGSALLCAYLGLSAALGAFLAGFTLSSTSFRFEIAGQLSAIRELFMAVFFTSVGLTVNPVAALEGWWVILLALALLLTVKSLSISLASWACGAPVRLAATVGLYLAQAGEFTLIMLAAQRDAGLVNDHDAAIATLVVLISLMVTPTMMERTPRLVARLPNTGAPRWVRSRLTPESASPTADDSLTPHAGHVIIAGFGPVGRVVADRLIAAKIPLVVVELNPKTVSVQRSLGRRVVFGDASNPEVLESADLHDADAVVLTMPDDSAMLAACKAVRSMHPDILIVARATYLSTMMKAKALGADHIIVEEVATAQAMESQVVDHVHKARAARAQLAPVTEADPSPPPRANT